jgi:mono/diheme cytochrome c family protein
MLLSLTACGGNEAASTTTLGTAAQRAIAPVIPTTPAAATPSAAEEASLKDAEWVRLGQSIYVANCAPCHQLNGEGRLNRFPALNGNAFVTARQPQPLIQTVLSGRGGVMPGFAPTLADQEIAAVLSYIRNAWSNSAPAIDANQVNQVKANTTPTPATTGEETGSNSH